MAAAYQLLTNPNSFPHERKDKETLLTSLLKDKFKYEFETIEQNVQVHYQQLCEIAHHLQVLCLRLRKQHMQHILTSLWPLLIHTCICWQRILVVFRLSLPLFYLLTPQRPNSTITTSRPFSTSPRKSTTISSLSMRCNVKLLMIDLSPNS